jgi:hypothetical protein
MRAVWEIFSGVQLIIRSILKFLDRGGVLVWGIVTSNFEPFGKEGIQSLEIRLHSIWGNLEIKGG